MAIVTETSTGTFSRVFLGRTGREWRGWECPPVTGCRAKPSSAPSSRSELSLLGSMRRDSFGAALRRLSSRRDQFALVIQSYTRAASLMGWSLERALRALRFDYTDVLLLGMWNGRGAADSRRCPAAQGARPGAISGGLHPHSRLVPATAADATSTSSTSATTPRIPAPKPTFSRICPMPAGRAWWHSPLQVGAIARKATLQGIAGSRSLPKGERIPTAADCYRYVLTGRKWMCA